jgi:hypothetical protein
MRHKIRVVDYDEKHDDDHTNGMYSSNSPRNTPVKWISSHVEAPDKKDDNRKGESSQIDNERSFTLRTRFAIIVGLSLFLWAVLIGTAVALLG